MSQNEHIAVVDKDEIAKQSSAIGRQNDRAYEDVDDDPNLSVSNDRIADNDDSLQPDDDLTSRLIESEILPNDRNNNRSPFDIDWAANRDVEQSQMDKLDAAHVTSELAAWSSESAALAKDVSPPNGSLAQIAADPDQQATESEIIQPAHKTEVEDFTAATNSVPSELNIETELPITNASAEAAGSQQTDATSGDDLELESKQPDTETLGIDFSAHSDSDSSDQSTREDAAFTYDALAHFSEVDSLDTLVYFLDGPDWLNIDSRSGQLSGIPQHEDVGTTEIVVRVMDPTGISVNISFYITIEITNDRAVVSAISDQASDEEPSFRYDASTHFADMDTSDTLIFSIDGPAWLAIDASTGELFGTPDNTDVAAASITVTASDETGEIAATTFNLTVSDTNSGPAASLIADQSAGEDASFTYRTAAHFDDVDAGDPLTYSLAGPDWLGIDVDTGVLSGTPTNDDIGIVSVTVVATDQSSRNTSIRFDLSVDNVNDQPSVTDIFDQITLDDTGFSYDAANHFGDVKTGDALSFVISGPDWLSIDPASGILSGTPNDKDIGPTLLTVTATDQSEAQASIDFHLVVTKVKNEPTVTAIEDLSAREDGSFAYDT